MEQEVIDMTNAIAREGLVFFPEFCSVCLRKLREDDEEQFAQIVFKVTTLKPQTLFLLPTLFLIIDYVWD